ncbi:MAG: DNA primase [Candidatus Margulisbacteria bacterium]|jgi:DNA primase|nr:DNA primase [Candidatus Margulisiibacteriota bacterium]
MIDPKTIEEIKLKSDIVAVVGRYVALKKRGRNYLGLCPFHKEKTPSFTVSPEKSLFHCFGCGKSGNVFAFIREMEQVDFVQAVRILGEQCGVAIEEIKNERYEQNEILYQINAEAALFFARQLAQNPEAQAYLQTRGLTPEVVQAFELGFAPDSWSALYDHLKSKFNPARVEEAGLLVKKDNGEYYDRFRKRLMFPIKNYQGKAIAFSGRIIDGSSAAKYMNSPETPIFSKGHNLYGLHLAKKQIAAQKQAVLVEGQMDVVACHAAGFSNTVASLGTAFTSSQARLLTRYSNNVVIAYDKDEAGLNATDKTIEVLAALNFQIRVLDLPAKDPDEMIKQHGAAALQAALAGAGDYVQYLLRRSLAKYDLHDRLQKSRAAQDCLRIIRNLGDRVLESEYIKWLSRQIGVGPEILHESQKSSIMPNFGKGVYVSRKYVPAPKDKYTKAEESLITAMLSDVELRRSFFAQFQPADLAEQWQGVLRYLQQNEFTDDKLIEQLEQDSAQQPELSALKETLSACLLTQTDRRLDGAACLRLLTERKKEELRQRLRGELAEAESAGEETKAAGLLQELQQLR